MRRLTFGLRFLWVAAAIGILNSVQTTFGEELATAAEEIVRLSDLFESARVAGDLDVAKHLMTQSATHLGINGTTSRSLPANLRANAARKRNSPGGKTEQVRVVNRKLAVHQDAAIVEEIIGAATDIEPGERVIPRRRTIVWVRKDDGWRIAHIHTSPYSLWEKSITAIEEKDAAGLPAEGGVVFVGSSSIRGWKTLQEDFPDANAIGCGFGGSQLIDSILYAHRIVTPYRPRAVAVYAGDNDIAAGKSAERVVNDFKLLVDTIQSAVPDARIGFIAIKPSIKRWEMWPKMKRANAMIEEFTQQHDLVDYLDIATPMLGEDGTPRPSLFVKDGLHLTPEGYELWTSVVSPWANHE